MPFPRKKCSQEEGRKLRGPSNGKTLPTNLPKPVWEWKFGRRKGIYSQSFLGNPQTKPPSPTPRNRLDSPKLSRDSGEPQ